MNLTKKKNPCGASEKCFFSGPLNVFLDACAFSLHCFLYVFPMISVCKDNWVIRMCRYDVGI